MNGQAALDVCGYRRIVIIGNNGSGKSYLSRKLSEIIRLPLVHLDLEFWRENWEMPSKEEWQARQIELVKGERWIIEGMHASTLEIRFRAADLVIFLDVNRLICLMGVLLRNGKKREDMPTYLQMKLGRQFFALCKGLWRFPKTRRPAIMALREKYHETDFLVIKGRRRMRALLRM